MLHALVLPVLAGFVVWAEAESADPPATWILQIEGDAARLEITGASRKPFAWRAPRASVSTYRVALVDADGNVVATAPLDLSGFCLKAEHRGQPAHLRGDRVVSHAVCITTKVPARDDVAELRILQLRAEQAPAVIGRIDRAALQALIDGVTETRRRPDPETEGTGRSNGSNRSEGQVAPTATDATPKSGVAGTEAEADVEVDANTDTKAGMTAGNRRQVQR